MIIFTVINLIKEKHLLWLGRAFPAKNAELRLWSFKLIHGCCFVVSSDILSDVSLLLFLFYLLLEKYIKQLCQQYAAPVISAERLKKYVYKKICTELPEGPFCIVYMHSTVQKEDNNPGLTILRWIYEELPSDHKDRLQAVYFVHPGLRSRLVLATLGRFFLSGG